MAGVTSLGIGSGVLTSDLLDKLRAADDNSILKPFTTNVTLANQQGDAAKVLSSLMDTFKSSTSAMGGDLLYLNRSVTGNTDAVAVTAQAGSAVQSFNITNVSKAEKDVWNTQNSFADKTAPIPGLGTGTFTITIGGKPLNIDYTPNTTLDDIKTAINDKASDTLTASSLQVGTSSYSLAIRADAFNQAITFSDSKGTSVAQKDTVTLGNNVVAGDTFTWSDGTNSITLDEALGGLVAGETPAQSGVKIADAINLDPTLSALYTATATVDGFTIEAKSAGTAFTGTATSTGTLTSAETNTTPNVDSSNSLATILGLKNIQAAKGATFDYNGIAISRSTNDVSDLINGVTITLNKNQTPTDTASIDIAQNSTSISSEMSAFVVNYNLLVKSLNDTTKLEVNNSAASGVFSHESFVKSIGRTIQNILTQVDSKGNSLMSYGISFNEDKTMSLNSSTFNTKFNEDPSAMELMFKGNSETDGIFKKLDTQMESYTKSDGQIKNFSDQLSKTRTNIITQYDKQKASLDFKYTNMAKQFTAYDAIISRANAQFASLKSMIDAQAKSAGN